MIVLVHLYNVDQIIKGLVHPQNENSVINYSTSCRSKPARPSFIFRTQIKIFVMKCESFLTLHRQQHNCNVPRSRNVARNGGRHNSGEKPVFFAHNCILVASQNWSWATDVTWTVLPMFLLRFWTWEYYNCVAIYGGSESSHISSYIS